MTVRWAAANAHLLAELPPALREAWRLLAVPAAHEAAANALNAITGQSLGTDPAKWQEWWEQQPARE